MASNPIRAIGSVSGNQPRVTSIAEDASQTFLSGVPVMVDQTDNAIVEWDGVTIGNGIAGISVNDASDLATKGVPQTLTFGQVENQPSAVNIPRGAPLNDGQMLVEVASDDSIFSGQVGPAQLAADAIIGTNYGLTKDTDDHWYVDLTVANQPTSVVTVIGIDQYDTRGVRFVFIDEVAQIVA